MSLTHQDVARIARLSRIAVTDAEIEAVGSQLNNILGLIEQMQAVNTDGIEPMAHPQDVSLRLREDAVTEPNAATPARRWRRKWKKACSWFPRSSNNAANVGRSYPQRVAILDGHQDKMINATLKQLSQQLTAGQVSAVELATAYLDRIEALNPVLNAFITVDREKPWPKRWLPTRAALPARPAC